MDNRGTGGETALDTAHVPLDAVLDSIPDPVLIIDERNEIVDANEAAGSLFDCRPEALLGRDWGECCPVEDRGAFEAIADSPPEERIDRFDAGGPIRIETFAGEYKPVELTLQRIFDGGEESLFCLCREVTERIEREQTLRETIARLETLFEASPVPMAVLDRNGNVERWNRAAESVFGWTPAAVTGEQYPLFTDDVERDEFLDRLRDGNRIAGTETTHQGRDGSLIDVELYAQPLREGGEVASILVSAIDITALKQREQHLSVLHRIMRHSLRNKLNVIYGVADELTVTDHEATDRLIAATEELMSLSDQAERIDKDLRRIENPVPVALDAILEAVRNQCRSTHPTATITLEPDVPQTPVPDVSRTIFEELVGHSIEHTEQAEPTVRITATVDRRVTISIHDDRDGLTAGEKAFLQRDESAALLHGSRLGLAHAEMLTTELGGQLAARERDNGTTTNVELPRSDPVPR